VAKAGLSWAIALPLLTELGQGTDSYRGLRWTSGKMIELLLANETSDPDFGMALSMLKMCAASTGHKLEPDKAAAAVQAVRETPGSVLMNNLTQ
jgi:hypothetical protein